ncbi:MAG: VTC domain-containing protein, partial [Kiritimatiellae bacterium]|nr:VTC domain-containing protein [Kiritimatiellia bacterium]
HLVRESKYVCEGADPALAELLVAAHSAPDAEHPAGVLESVYFDTPDLKSHAEKTDGDAVKRKIRIRWYPDSRPLPDGTRTAFLEVKDRIGAARDKARFEFRYDAGFLDNAPLDDRGFADMLSRALRDAGFAFSAAPYAPTVAIRYARKRFVCPATGSRLSVDSRICATRANAALIPFAAPLACPCVVVEAKSGTARQWPFGAALVRMGYRLSGFSKYGFFLDRLRAGAFR